MNEYNLRDYKDSKILLPHLETILKILAITTKSLKPFNNFLSVYRILNLIEEEKRILEINYQKYKKINKNKGKK